MIDPANWPAGLFAHVRSRVVGDDQVQYAVSLEAVAVVTNFLDHGGAPGQYDRMRLGQARAALLAGIDAAEAQGLDDERTDVVHHARLMVQALGAVESGDPMRAGELALYAMWTPPEPLRPTLPRTLKSRFFRRKPHA